MIDIFPDIKNFYMRLNLLISSKVGRIFLATTISFPVMSNLQLSIVVFIIAFVADFGTGWLASSVEIKKGLREKPKSGYSFESSAARKSLIKGIGYVLFIFSALALEVIFFDKKLTLSTLSTKSFGITELAIGFCTVIEMYSAVIENMTRAGFDIIKKITTVVESIKSVVTKIKEWIK